MAPIIIYGMTLSAPTRILMMTCEVLGLEYELKICDLFAGDQNKPEYLKLNPQRLIPTLVDGDFVTNESRPAAVYLVNKYGGEKKKELYPDDPETRCKIDQRMYFDMGTLYKSFGDCIYPVLLSPQIEFESAKVTRFNEVMGWVHDYIKNSFAAGTDHLTLADICFVSSISTFLATEAFDLSQYNPELKEWMDKCKNLIPNFEKVNVDGAAVFGEWYKKVAASKKKN